MRLGGAAARLRRVEPGLLHTDSRDCCGGCHSHGQSISRGDLEKHACGMTFGIIVLVKMTSTLMGLGELSIRVDLGMDLGL